MKGKQKNPKANDRAPTVQRRTANEAAVICEYLGIRPTENLR